MKRIFLDTNIIIDLLAEREPFYESAAKLATLADQKKIVLISSTLSFANVNYVLSKFDSSDLAMQKLRKFRILCEVASVNQEILDKALNSNFSDFEDALQYFSALQSKCEIIITRNGKDFKKSTLAIFTAEEYINSIQHS